MKLLITGAAGWIGREFVHEHGHLYDLKLTDVQQPNEINESLDWRFGNLTDPDFCDQVVQGVDTILHLAANPNWKASFDVLHGPNIVAVNNLFDSAEQAGVQRIVYASSVHAVLGYPAGVPIEEDWPAKPAWLYGATKVYGEGLCSAYSTHGISCIAVRIGAYNDHHYADKIMDTEWRRQFVSKRDTHQALRLCIEAPPDLKYAIVHASSDNEDKRLAIDKTRSLLGYAPQDSAPVYLPEVTDTAPLERSREAV